MHGVVDTCSLLSARLPCVHKSSCYLQFLYSFPLPISTPLKATAPFSMLYLLLFAAFIACILRWAAFGSVAAVLLVAIQVIAIIMMDAMSTNPIFVNREDANGGAASTARMMDEVEWEETGGVLEQV